MSTNGLAHRPLLDDPDRPLSVEQVKAVMPKRQKQNITDSLIREMNLLVDEPDVRAQFRENILGYTDVLSDPHTTLPNYIQAVKYVSYKLLGYTNQESWIKTFPHRYQRLIDKEAEGKYIRSVICNYNRGKLVNRILEQTMVPTYVLNQDVYQQAINTQAQLMMNAKSEKVRTDAANSLLSHLKQPETTKLNLDVRVVEDDSVKELRLGMLELVAAQKQAIQSGTKKVEEIAESKIVTGECERIE